MVANWLLFPLFFCSQNHLNLVLVNNVPLFFSVRDGPYMPTLRLLHQCKVYIYIFLAIFNFSKYSLIWEEVQVNELGIFDWLSFVFQ